MPAIDQCEPQVVRALQKIGWVITHQPFPIRVDENRASFVFADIRLEQLENQQSIIIVEVKCFADIRRLLDEFYHAVGQYVAYQVALQANNIQTPLYLAIPESVYATFFQKPLIRAVIAHIQAKLVIVNLEKEEVARWIP